MDRTAEACCLTLAGPRLLATLVVVVPPLRDAVTNVVSGDAGELRQELRDLGRRRGARARRAGARPRRRAVPLGARQRRGRLRLRLLARAPARAGRLAAVRARHLRDRARRGAAAAAAAGGRGAAGGGRAAGRARRRHRAARRAARSRSCPTAPSATSRAPRRCRCGASPGRPWSARCPCAPRSCTSASGSTRSRRPTPACSSPSAPSWRCSSGGRVLRQRASSAGTGAHAA